MGRPRIAQLTSKIPRVEHLPTQLFLGYLPFSRWVVNFSYPPMCLYNCVYIMLVVSSPCFYNFFICVWWCFIVFHSYILHIHENVAWECQAQKSASLLSSEYFSSPMVGITSTSKRSQIHQHLKLHVSATENDTEWYIWTVAVSFF